MGNQQGKDGRKGRREVIANESLGEFSKDDLKVWPKTDKQKEALTTALKKHFLFEEMDADAVNLLLDAMQPTECKPGGDIVTQGEKGSVMYIIDSGTVKIVIDGKEVATIPGPFAFGELSLMYHAPRAATVRPDIASAAPPAEWAEGIEPSEGWHLWSIDGLTFRRVLSYHKGNSSLQLCTFLRKVPLFEKLPSHQITKIAEAMEVRSYMDGDLIIKEGEEGSDFFIILEGSARVMQLPKKGADGDGGGGGSSTPKKKLEDAKALDAAVQGGDDKLSFPGSGANAAEAVPVQLAVLQAGDFFGERALLKNEARDATIETMGACKCVVLDRNEFTELLGPLQDLLEKVTEKRDEEAAAAQAADPAERMSQLETLVPDGSSIADNFVEGRCIGKGTFGRVKVVTHKTSGRAMAMKCLWKQHVLNSHQVKNVVQEKNSLASMDHPFVLKLYGTWQDDLQLYMFFELLQGGELWSLLYENTAALERVNAVGGLLEDVARMYACNVLEGFSCIHGAGYAYRDLKPENLLLDNDGYIKIVDFGFAKRLRAGAKTQTLCGTPEYLSPELVLSQGHNKCVDYWAFGVLTFELLYGETPFVDEDQSKIFKHIVHSNRVLGRRLTAARLPSAAKDLIRRLLCKNPALRLGMLRGGMDDVKMHPWFHGIEWDKLRGKKYRTPWMPPCKGADDVSNFDEFEDDAGSMPFKGDPRLFQGF